MPKLLLRQYAKVLYQITKELSGKELDRAVLEFFKLLKDNQMLKKVDLIVEEFLQYAKECEGIDKITITSAHKLSKQVTEEIAKKFSKHFEVAAQIDESLIGGVKVRKGNTIFNTSVRSDLEALEQALKH